MRVNKAAMHATLAQPSHDPRLVLTQPSSSLRLVLAAMPAIAARHSFINYVIKTRRQYLACSTRLGAPKTQSERG